MMRNLTAKEVQAAAQAGTSTLLDVRTDEELAIASLPEAIHIPLAELPQRLDELDRNRPIIAICHHGVRSEMAGRMLERGGFADVAHLVGGIDAWSLDIDPEVPRY
jgi:rhodanese-related sulfurtransferase